jgi:hypothetical protein
VRPGLVCEKNPCDDGNECTFDISDDGCQHDGCTGCQPCDWNGVPGVCINGVCEEDICLNVVCDDGDACTVDLCDFVDGCYFRTAPEGTSCDWNGVPGVCINGVCGQDPCDVVVCDDGDLCTQDSCWLGRCGFSWYCYDDNECTEDICDAGTGECSFPPADGRSCCLFWICILESCSCWHGTCQDRRCAPSTEVQP